MFVHTHDAVDMALGLEASEIAFNVEKWRRSKHGSAGVATQLWLWYAPQVVDKNAHQL